MKLNLFKLKSSGVVVSLCLLLLAACKKDNNQPELTWPEDGRISAIELISGDKQAGIFGETLKDSIVMKVSGREGKSRIYWLKYRFLEGNGNVKVAPSDPFEYVDISRPDNDGYVKLKWELGCNKEEQELLVLLYSDSIYYNPDYAPNKPADDSVIVSAKGSKPTGWGKSCGCEINDYYSSGIFSHNGKLYLVSPNARNGGLYMSEDGGINWMPLQGFPFSDEIVSARFGENNRLYVLTRNSGVYYSDNLSNWSSLNNGLLGFSYPSAFLIAPNFMYVSFEYNGLFRSADKGAFWKKILVENGYATPYRFISRNANNDLYLFDKWDTFYVSKDNGDSWKSIFIDYQYRRSTIEDFKTGPDGKLYIGSGDATLAIISPDTFDGITKSYYTPNSSSQHINHIQFFNNQVYFLVNGSNNDGIYSSATGWGKVDLTFKNRIFNYHVKEDGDFLLMTDRGVYYKVK